jgi:hypothetical protein
MGNLGRLFDASTISSSLQAGTDFNIHKPLKVGLQANVSAAAEAIKNRPQTIIPMMDPAAIQLQQKRLQAQQAASAGGRNATVLTGSAGGDTSDRLGP